MSSKQSKMTVSLRLGLGFGAVIALMLVLVAVGVQRVGVVDQALTRVVDVNSVRMNHAIDMRGSVHDTAIEMRDVILARNNRELETNVSQIEVLRQDYAEAVEALTTILEDRDMSTDRSRNMYRDIRQIEQKTVPMLEEVIQLSRDGLTEQARDLLRDEAGPAFSQWLGAINVMIDNDAEQVSADTAGARDNAEAFAVVMLIMLAISAVIAALIAVLITRYFRRTLGGEPHDALAFINRIEDGDLTARAETPFPDSIMGVTIRMRDGLREIIGTLKEGVDTINTASSEIATGNTDLSQRTEEQASNLEETAASMEEITSTVKQNADNARQGNSLARGAREAADKGGDIVDQVVQTMGRINESSKKVSDIISVIDGIAFQTNILALNAAVEAARAGEQGRGFAVVASEVRSLAQRSATAAKEIKDLISESVENVQSGSELVDRAGQSMEEILGSIKQVSDIIGEISAASDEQSTGIEEINQAVTQMDQVTQQNAALVEEAAAAAESLQSQAEELSGVVASFKLHSNQPLGKTATGSAPRTQPGQPGQSGSASAQGSSNKGGQTQGARKAPAQSQQKPKTAPAQSQSGARDDDDWEEF
ncbi:MAG: methyl-accepting chemotaxis protein [Oleiphilaceae bacterium]|nr:methyl-accepting chemotaxis protein [Oleiphilaceae bacterium]